MKSYVTAVMALYEGIMVDAAIRWPDIRSSMDMDLSYLRRASEERGIGFFTLTLPDYGQWLDESLDHGSFVDYVGVPRGIPLYRGRPRLFWGILMKVFSTDGMLRSTADPEAVLFLRTLTQGAKKLELPIGSKALRKTLKEFFNVEDHLPTSHPETWDSDTPTWTARFGHPLWGVLGEEDSQNRFDFPRVGDCRVPWDALRLLCRRVTSELGIPNWWELRPKHGPGAVSEHGWETKYDFPNWPRKLGLWFPFDWFGSGSLDPESVPSEVEPCSRLVAVPKTRKGPRLICCEPIAHQWMQQSIWRWLRKRVPKTTLGRSISFESQERQREWALSASHNRLRATLDLSAASDRLSTRLVEYVFQGSELLDGFHSSRTRAMEQTLSDEFPKLIKLRKFATMGSALTFPVQSIVFTILCVFALRLHEGREFDFSDWKADFDRVRVFGDDIIVPNHAYGITKFVLHECGLLVNSRKSFKGVSFRESCGMDAFRGIDVTPARYRKPYDGSPASTAALIECSNNLFKKGMWNASEKVLDLLPVSQRKLLAVSGPDEGNLGLYSFCGSNVSHLRKRWDIDLQRDYVKRFALLAQPRSTAGSGSSRLARYFFERRSTRTEYDSDNLSRKNWREVLFPIRPLGDFQAGAPRLKLGTVRVYL